MIKKKYLLAILLMLSISLTGCDLDDVEFAERVEETVDDDSTLEENENDEVFLDDKYFNNSKVYNNGLYDDTKVSLIELYDPIKEDSKKFIVENTHHIILDSEEFKDLESFWNDAKEASEGFITDEQVLNSEVYFIISTYESISNPNNTYNEKRTIFRYKEDGEEKQLCTIEERVSIPEDEISVFMRTSFFDKSSICKWAFVEKEDSLADFSEKSLVTQSNIAKGFYTKDELIELEKEYNKEKKKKKIK